MTELVLAADLSSERVEVDVFLWLGIIMTGFVFLDKLVRDVLTWVASRLSRSLTWWRLDTRPLLIMWVTI